VETVKVPIKDAQGRVTGIQGIFWDVTERHNAALLLEIQRDLAFQLSSVSSDQEALRAILEGALRLPCLDGGSIYRANADGSFVLTAHRGLSPEFIQRHSRLAADSEQARTILAGRLVCSCSTPDSHCTDPQLIQDPLINKEGILSAVILPIVAHGKILACLNLASHFSRRIARETLMALETLAIQFGNSLERMAAEERLRLAANVFDHSHDGILITDAGGHILEANAAFTTITGYTRKEVLGNNPRLLQSGRHGAEFYRELWRTLLADGQWQGEIWNRRKDGEVFAELLNISAVKNHLGKTTHYVAIFVDITLLKRYQEHLEALAHFDALTGLPNRVLLADRIQMAMANARRSHTRLAVGFLDLDGFKEVNDSLGHEGGDDMLRQVAERLRQTVRELDTVARLGGDEFAILLGGIRTQAECEQALERILQAIASPYQIAGVTAHVSGSLGVTLYPEDEQNAEQLLRHADQAMYQAKQAGKNQYHFFTPHGAAPAPAQG
jgi:diguanylate cyclase (GGDEF)-like protein/PAS domain S-box-containing protein